MAARPSLQYPSSVKKIAYYNNYNSHISRASARNTSIKSRKQQNAKENNRFPEAPQAATEQRQEVPRAQARVRAPARGQGAAPRARLQADQLTARTAAALQPLIYS